MRDAERPQAGRRQHVTVLFADICGYTKLNEQHDPEELAPMLAAVRELVTRVVAEHGGAINEWRGDGVVCVFGLPQAHEDDARRAVRASLQLHASTRTLPLPPGLEGLRLRLHSGIDTGLVFAREGDLERGRYELIGDTVNTAARLCGAASEDEILAAETTLEGILEFFETEPVGGLTLKGKREEVRARRISGTSGVATRFRASMRRGLTPLIGRQAFLEQLAEGVTQARRGQLQVVYAVGSAGVGKTRLLEEFERRLDEPSTRVLRGNCESSHSAPSLQPFRQILSQLFEHPSSVGDSAGEQLSVLRDLLGKRTRLPSTPPEALQESIVATFSDLLHALTSDGLAVLIVDDWQWSDEASGQVLARALERLRDRPAFVLIASRTLPEAALESARVLSLEPFTREESAAAVGRLVPHAFDMGMVAALHRRSGGNPFYLEELCRSLPAQAPGSEEDLVLAVPTTLKGLIRARVDGLPSRVNTAIHAAAVMGMEFTFPLLQATLHDAGESVTLEDLIDSDLIYPSDAQGGFRFTHGIAQEVVYDAVRIHERRRLHRAAASALEKTSPSSTALSPPLEALAHHHAGGENYAQAATYSELAGDRAAATSFLDRARQLYKDALEALDKQPQTRELQTRWVAVASKLATACLYRPTADILPWIRRMGEYAEALGDPKSVARADYWLGWFRYAFGEQATAIEHYRQSLERAESLSDERLIVQLQLNLGQSFAAACEYAEATRYFELAMQRPAARGGEHTRRTSTLGLAYGFASRAIMHGALGEFDVAHDLISQALTMLPETLTAIEASCLGFSSMLKVMQGDWSGALRAAERTAAAAHRVSGPYVLAFNRVVAGYARWMLDGSSEALADMLNGSNWMERRGLLLYNSFLCGQIADILCRVGDVAKARSFAQRALERVVEMDASGEAMAYRVLARIRASEVGPEADDVRDLLLQAIECAPARGSRREQALTELLMADHQRASGQVDAAEQTLAGARAALLEMNMPAYAEPAFATLGR